MKRSDGYTLVTIADVPYLLPYGQRIADQKRGIRLNETGAFIWNALEQINQEDALVDALAAHYEASSDERPILEKDTKEFLHTLQSYGMLRLKQKENAASDPDCCYLQIAGLTLKLCGFTGIFPEEFVPYSIPHAAHIDQTITVHTGSPQIEENGELILRSKELMICRQNDGYLLLFPTFSHILEASLSFDGSNAFFYCLPMSGKSDINDLFHAIRFVFLYLAQKRGMFALHSASILYREKAWLFSGHSGMGKTTHTTLWNERYQTPILNGDLNLITCPPDGNAVVRGIPWCGTSGISDTATYPLGGIVLLGRAGTSHYEALSEDRKALLVMQRLISPTWTQKQFLCNLHFTQELSGHIPVCKLYCSKDASSVETIKEWIDRQ